MDRLVAYNWPGNVRELENTIERSMVLASRGILEAGDIRIENIRQPAHAAAHEALLPEGMTLEQWEQSMIQEAMKRAKGNKSQAARLLGLTRNALRYRLSQIGLDGGKEAEAEEDEGEQGPS
jgi:DNA-binding NtrC family response regulator